MATDIVKAYVEQREAEALGLRGDFPEWSSLRWYERLWYWLVSL